MSTVFIYVLRCPSTFCIRYVGKTKHPVERLRQHAYPKRQSHRECWIRSLLRGGLYPILEILDEVPEVEWPMWEVAYIEFFREQGCPLVNANAGGEGGHNPSEETRQKIGAAKVGNTYGAGRKMPEHVRQKIKLANTGRKHPGRKLSEEHKKKISIAHLNRKPLTTAPR